MIVSIIVAVLALSILIFVHELSHFLIAKASSIDAPVFSIGFGPRLFSFKWKETDFRVSAIPFGGYVQLKGMEPDEIKGERNEFYSRNVVLRIATVFGGPFANILFGFLLYLGIFGIGGIEVPDTTIIGSSAAGSYLIQGDRILSIDNNEVFNWYDITKDLKNGSEVLLIRDGEEKRVIADSVYLDSLFPQYPPIVGMVDKGGPAYSSGIREGARILAINGKKLDKWEDITTCVYPAAGDSLSVLYCQNGDTALLTMVPKEQKALVGDSVVSRGIIGITSPIKTVKISFPLAVSFASKQTWGTATIIFRSISLLIHRKVSARNLAGPVGIVMLTQQSMRWGLNSLLSFVALLSVNLAIVNLIPIPPLDGFHIVASVVSSIVRRKPSKKMLQIITVIGTMILLSLMALLLLNDILRIFSGGM